MKKFLWVILTVGFLKAGWIIKFEEKGPQMPADTSTNYISNGILANVSKDDVFIINFKTEKITFISHREKEYYEGTVDEFVSALSGIHSSMKKEMQEMMKDMPPEQRKMMEKMMSGPEVKVEKTGKTAKVLGYNTVIYNIKVTTPGPMKSTYKTEDYISPDLKIVPSEISKEDAERISKKFEKLTSQAGMFDIGKIEEGFSLKSVTYGPDGKKMSETRAISVKKGGIPSSVLKIPAGYKKARGFKELYMPQR